MQRNARYGWLLAVALCALAGVALASSPREVRKQAEASRLVAGTVDFNEEGRVTTHTFKDADDLAPEMRNWLDQRVTQWRFEPVVVDGKPRLARTNMTLRLVLKPLDEKKFSFRIASASFYPDREAASYKPDE